MASLGGQRVTAQAHAEELSVHLNKAPGAHARGRPDESELDLSKVYDQNNAQLTGATGGVI